MRDSINTLLLNFARNRQKASVCGLGGGTRVLGTGKALEETAKYTPSPTLVTV